MGWLKIDPALAARTYRDPLALTGLAVDLLPILAVVFLGWGAVALVMLYWLENLVIGAVTVARLLGAGLLSASGSFAQALFMSVFFTVHFGMFCFVHGVFLRTISGLAGGGATDFPTPAGLVSFAMESGPAMAWIIGAIIAFNAVLYIHDFIGRGEARDADLNAEMMAPYGRIVVLHVGLFVGMGALIAIGEPLAGVLALIVLRAVWGVLMALRRRRALEAEAKS